MFSIGIKYTIFDIGSVKVAMIFLPMVIRDSFKDRVANLSSLADWMLCLN
jgi:hypothetical protein